MNRLKRLANFAVVAQKADRQNLTFYELDLGLNHVVRKWSEPTDRRANLLVQGASAQPHLETRLMISSRWTECPV